jgi:hypothetical protein
MRASSAAAATLRTLIAAIPDDRLRDLFIGLVLNSLTSPPPRTAQPTSRSAPPPAPRNHPPPATAATARPPLSHHRRSGSMPRNSSHKPHGAP